MSATAGIHVVLWLVVRSLLLWDNECTQYCMPESRRGISWISRGSYIFLGSRGNVAWLPIEIAWRREDREEEGKGEGVEGEKTFLLQSMT